MSSRRKFLFSFCTRPIRFYHKLEAFLDSVGLCWTRVQLGSKSTDPISHEQSTENFMCVSDWSRTRSNSVQSVFTISWMEVGPPTPFSIYNIIMESNRGRSEADANIVLGTRLPNGTYLQKSRFEIWHELFSHRWVILDTFLEKGERSDDTSVHIVHALGKHGCCCCYGLTQVLVGR